MDSMIIKQCPHCKDYIIVKETELNCKIFRHGTYKNNLEQINPHLPKEDCDKLIEKDLIYGCGKPFRLNINTKTNGVINYTTEICDYI